MWGQRCWNGLGKNCRADHPFFRLVSDIAKGAGEWSTGLVEISSGMTQLDQVTQQNAAVVEETTAAGHILDSDASNLAEILSPRQMCRQICRRCRCQHVQSFGAAIDAAL